MINAGQDVRAFAAPIVLPPPGCKKGWPWTIDDEASPSHQRRPSWPRITVVIPSFNQGQFIEEAIRSVLIQQYPNIETIVIDGGSTDNSVEIIRKYEPWIAYWASEKDRGQSHAINKGFERATGDIFAWLCSDDAYARGAFQKVADTLGNKKLSMAVGHSVTTYGPDTLEGTLDQRRPSFADMAYNIRTFPQPSVFWTKDLWQAAGPLKEDLYFAMDFELWLRMVPAAKSVLHIGSILSCQRTQPDQKSNVNHPRFREYRRLRVEIPWKAALARGESSLGWLARVWWYQVRKRRGRLWRLAKRGFHWEALQGMLHRG